jgi:hypothetical protein
MRVGVVGAAGALGRSIVSQLEATGAVVVPVDPRRPGRPSTGAGSIHAAGLAEGDLERLLTTLQALVVAAPLTDETLHRTAVRSGCNVVEVNVGELNRALLTLDEEAAGAGQAVVAMAGLAPGLTGLLGSDVLSTFEPPATTVCVALLQSPTGAAGVQGTRDMLDLLTAPEAGYRIRPVQDATGTIRDAPLFGLRNAEPEISGLHRSLELGTGFDHRGTHAQLRTLKLLRSVTPVLYGPLRDRIAERKARTPGRDETTVLSAVALDESGAPVGGRSLTVSSDYGATAAVAASVALAAGEQQLRTGAGHLRRFVTLAGLLEMPPLRSVVCEDTGPLPAPPRAARSRPASGPASEARSVGRS